VRKGIADDRQNHTPWGAEAPKPKNRDEGRPRADSKNRRKKKKRVKKWTGQLPWGIGQTVAAASIKPFLLEGDLDDELEHNSYIKLLCLR